MKLLLDTHAVLWWRLDSPRLKKEARNAIATADVVWVSAASGWEVAIKQGLGKLHLSEPFEAMVHGSRFDEFAVTLAHAARVASLPAHHADPFDRMLIAQAFAEGATIVTHDEQFRPYGVPVLWI